MINVSTKIKTNLDVESNWISTLVRFLGISVELLMTPIFTRYKLIQPNHFIWLLVPFNTPLSTYLRCIYIHI